MDGLQSADSLLASPDPTRRGLSRARHAPGDIYASPEIYRREIDEYFSKDWLFAGRVEQFDEPGDYQARRLIGRPIVIARDKDGTLGAFYNMCVHRGVEVADGSGNAREFKCPYHGWTYDLAGRLTGAAYMRGTEGFRAADCRMAKIHLETWRGNIFINFAVVPAPFQDAVQEFEKDFAGLRTEDCRVADVMTINLKCNWKFFHENLMDFYHVNVLHAKSFGARFAWDPDKVVAKPGGGLTIHYDAAPSTPDGLTRFAKAPWLADQPDSFACTGFLPPNLTLFGRIDCVKLMQAWPLGPDACEVLIYLLFPKSFFADPDFGAKLKVYHDYQKVIYEEDRSMIESMQLAMASPAYVPGRMSMMEKPIHHFLGSYLDRMFGPVTA
jgi:Rieske 2Fe-2S family protein